MATITTNDVLEYIEKEIARHSLQGNSGELRQLRRVTAFLARVAQDVNDSANQQRFLNLYNAANTLLNNQPLDRSS